MKFYRLVLFVLLLSTVFPWMSHAGQLEDAIAAIDNKDFKKAYELLQPLAEEGNVEAQTHLGALYINGQGVDRDIPKGLSWVMKAANQGYETAMRIAFKVHLDLVDQNDPAILFNLGYMCLKGWAGKQNTSVCLGWLENAGRIGHENSLKLLAKIYAEGLHGIAPDEEKATYWSNLQAGFAAGLDGKWEGSVSMGPDAPPTILTYNFKTDGDRLTGTAGGERGGDNRISNGKIDGNDFSFTVRSNYGGMKIKYIGTFYGNTIKLTYTIEMSSSRITGSRSLRSNNADGGDFPPVAFTARRVE